VILRIVSLLYESAYKNRRSWRTQPSSLAAASYSPVCSDFRRSVASAGHAFLPDFTILVRNKKRHLLSEQLRICYFLSIRNDAYLSASAAISDGIAVPSLA
jgi:hypothetical protein